MDFILKKVHELYWKDDLNCASTMLVCLGELFSLKYDGQMLNAAVGLLGAGGFRAQCGLAEGGLMFIGVYFSQIGRDEKSMISICYNFAELFIKKFGSLQCFDCAYSERRTD